MDVKTVIFDLDGTLIDSAKDIALAVNKTLEYFGIPLLLEDKIISYVGHGAEVLIKKSIGEENMDRFDDILIHYKKTYYENCIIYTNLYNGVRDILNYLEQRNINIALATNKPLSLSKKILEHFDIIRYFCSVKGPESVKNRKPHCEVVESIIGEVNGKREETLIVGDSDVDTICGKNAGILTCGVTYGIGSTEAMINAKPDFIICDIRSLKILLS